MRKRRAIIAGLAVAGWLAGGWLGGDRPAALAQDDLGGLPPGPGQEEVFYTCSACHSIQLVRQQGLSRQRWEELLVWMVEEQGMAEPPEEDRKLILDYLAEHFGPERQRGAPGGLTPMLPPLMPLPRAGGAG